MKKTRLISLLLSAALVASCLPMAVSAAEEANLLDGATITAVRYDSGEVDEEGNTIYNGSNLKAAAFKNPDGSDVVEGNKFLTIAKRAYSLGQGFFIYYTLTEEQAAKQLYVDFDLRTSQTDANGKAPNGCLYINGTQFVAPNQIFGSGIHGTGNWYSMGEKAIPVANNIVGTNYVQYGKGSGAYQTQNLDIDNIKVYYKDADGNPVYLVNVTDNFLETTDAADSTINTIVPQYKVSKYTAVAFEDEEEAYMIADSDDLYNTELAITFEEALEPGVYTLSGEFRLGEFSGIGVTDAQINEDASLAETIDADHYTLGINDADLFLVAGDNTSAATNVNTIWADQEWEIVVTEATDVITLLVDGKEETIADPQKINFRNLNLVQTDSFVETFETADAANILNGVTVTYSGIADRGNGYLVVPERTSDTKGTYLDIAVTTDFTGARDVINEETGETTIEGGREYFFGFDVWAKAADAMRLYISRGFSTVDAISGVTGTASDGTTPLNGAKMYNTYPWVTENNELSYGWELRGDGRVMQKLNFAKATWQHYESSFVPYNSAANTVVFTLTYASSGNIQELHIDNVELYYYDDNGEKVVVYSNEFDSVINLDGSNGTISTIHESLDVAVVPAAVAVTPVGNAIIATYDVADIADTTATYTFTATVAAEAGNAWLEVTYANNKVVATDSVAVTADGVELTAVAEDAIKSIKLVTDITGAVSIANEKLTAVRPVLLGDANGDGKVNALDVTHFFRYLGEWAGYAESVVVDALDINNDGTVESGDAVALARYLAKWIGYKTFDDINGMEY